MIALHDYQHYRERLGELIDRYQPAYSDPFQDAAPCWQHSYEGWIVVFPRDGDDDYFIVMEKHPDGTVTEWNYAMFGAIGHSGKLKKEVRTKPVTRAKERREVDRIRRMVERGQLRSQEYYERLKGI